MKYEVKLPDIGEGVVEGEVIEWLKKPGEEVSKDEPVVIVMTDKATVELPSPKSGSLSRQHYEPGQIAKVGKPLYELEIAEEEKKEESLTTKIKKPVHPVPPEPKAKPKSRPEGQKALATPHTRSIAKELGIDINQIQGSGKNGKVLPEDLKGAQTPSYSNPLPGDRIEPVIGISRRMAQTMADSKRIIPHFTYTEQVEADRLIALRKKVQQEIPVTYMPFFIRALSLTMKQFPKLNSSYDAAGERIIFHEQHNIGIAMSTPQGLIVPVLKNVQDMHPKEIIKSYEELKKRTKENHLSSSDMQDATISITNFGVLGRGRWATPIITPPASAILGVAKIQKSPVVKGSQVIALNTLNLSWSFDHRIIDGDLAAAVSHHFATLIQNPAALL